MVYEWIWLYQMWRNIDEHCQMLSSGLELACEGGIWLAKIKPRTIFMIDGLTASGEKVVYYY